MAITISATGEGGQTTNSTTYTSGNITASEDDIIIAFAASALNGTQTLSSLSMPSIGSGNWNAATNITATSVLAYYAQWAVVPAGGVTAEQITATWSTTCDRGQIHVLVVTGANTTTPVVQSGVASTSSGGHQTVSGLSAFASGSAAVGGLCVHNASIAVAFPTTPAWTDGTIVEPGEALEGRAGYYIGEDTDVTTTGSATSTHRGLIVMEIAEAAAAAGGMQLVGGRGLVG